MATNEDSWHLSKSVPVALIFGLITQGAAIVWTASMMMADIEDNRDDVDRLQSRVGKIEEAVQGQAVSVARMDENIKAIRNLLESMARRVDP